MSRRTDQVRATRRRLEESQAEVARLQGVIVEAWRWSTRRMGLERFDSIDNEELRAILRVADPEADVIDILDRLVLSEADR